LPAGAQMASAAAAAAAALHLAAARAPSAAALAAYKVLQWPRLLPLCMCSPPVAARCSTPINRMTYCRGVCPLTILCLVETVICSGNRSSGCMCSHSSRSKRRCSSFSQAWLACKMLRMVRRKRCLCRHPPALGGLTGAARSATAPADQQLCPAAADAALNLCTVTSHGASSCAAAGKRYGGACSGGVLHCSGGRMQL
jgi:hypothetical protein